jgi:hypothetical protein
MRSALTFFDPGKTKPKHKTIACISITPRRKNSSGNLIGINVTLQIRQPELFCACARASLNPPPDESLRQHYWER